MDEQKWFWGLDYQICRERDGQWRVYRWRSGGGWDMMGNPILDTGQGIEDVRDTYLREQAR